MVYITSEDIEMTIRRAEKTDIDGINKLLRQVLDIHHNGRPDIFKTGTKYSEEELKTLLKDERRPILVSTNENDEVRGYCFCIPRKLLEFIKRRNC